MSAAPNRLLLRQARIFGRRSNQRHASTTSQAADAASSTATKTKEKASDATSKASQGLSRVTSSAGPALSGAAQGVSNALGRVGGRTGRLISFVECKLIAFRLAVSSPLASEFEIFDRYGLMSIVLFPGILHLFELQLAYTVFP